MFTPLHDLTIEQLDKAAKDHASGYDRMFQKVARTVFIEAVLWAQKLNNQKITL